MVFEGSHGGSPLLLTKVRQNFDEHFGKFSQKSLIWFVKKIEEEVHPL